MHPSSFVEDIIALEPRLDAPSHSAPIHSLDTSSGRLGCWLQEPGEVWWLSYDTMRCGAAAVATVATWCRPDLHRDHCHCTALLCCLPPLLHCLHCLHCLHSSRCNPSPSPHPGILMGPPDWYLDTDLQENQFEPCHFRHIHSYLLAVTKAVSLAIPALSLPLVPSPLLDKKWRSWLWKLKVVTAFSLHQHQLPAANWRPVPELLQRVAFTVQGGHNVVTSRGLQIINCFSNLQSRYMNVYQKWDNNRTDIIKSVTFYLLSLEAKWPCLSTRRWTAPMFRHKTQDHKLWS